jgi:hypothetical protein
VVVEVGGAMVNVHECRSAVCALFTDDIVVPLIVSGTPAVDASAPPVSVLFASLTLSGAGVTVVALASADALAALQGAILTHLLASGVNVTAEDVVILRVDSVLDSSSRRRQLVCARSVLVARVRCSGAPGPVHPDDPRDLLAAPAHPVWLPLSDCPARALVLLQQVGVQVDFAVVTHSAVETSVLGRAMGADVAALGNRITTALVPHGLLPGAVSVTVRTRTAMGPHPVYPCAWGGGGVG